MKYTHMILWKEKSALTGIYVKKYFSIFASDIASYRSVFEGKLRLGDISSYEIRSL